MQLSELFQSSRGVGSGTVQGSLLNGQYRVLFKGRTAIALSQAGTLFVGDQVTIAETDAGLIVVSVGQRTAAAILEVTISG